MVRTELMEQIIKKKTYFLCVILMQLRLLTISSPKAQNFIFGTVSHVDQPLEPPPLNDYARYRSEHQSVISHFHKSIKIKSYKTNSIKNEIVLEHISFCTYLNSPVQSMPWWTVKLCRCKRRDPNGFKSISLPFCKIINAD